VLTERSSTAAGAGYRIMDYVWGAQYIDEVVCRIDRTQTPAVRMDFVQDANWNVITLLEADGDVAERYRYDAYGKPTFMNPDGTTKTTGILNSTYLFQGRRLIAWKNSNVDIQAYHYRMREYLPVLGRPAQRDPLGNTDSLNLYEYVTSNPIVLTDPTGGCSRGEVKLPACKCCCVLAMRGLNTTQGPQFSDPGVHNLLGHKFDIEIDLTYKTLTDPNDAASGKGCNIEWREWVDVNPGNALKTPPRTWTEQIANNPTSATFTDYWRHIDMASKCNYVAPKWDTVLFHDTPKLGHVGAFTRDLYIRITAESAPDCPCPDPTGNTDPIILHQHLEVAGYSFLMPIPDSQLPP